MMLHNQQSTDPNATSAFAYPILTWYQQGLMWVNLLANLVAMSYPLEFLHCRGTASGGAGAIFDEIFQT